MERGQRMITIITSNESIVIDKPMATIPVEVQNTNFPVEVQTCSTK